MRGFIVWSLVNFLLLSQISVKVSLKSILFLSEYGDFGGFSASTRNGGN